MRRTRQVPSNVPNLVPISLAATGLLAAFCTTDVKSASVPENSDVPASGKLFFQNRNINVTNLYNDTCAKCHGINGEGGGGGTKTLLEDDMFDQKLDRPYFDAIKDGVPHMGMEAYGGTMSDEVVWSLVVHVRELQGKAYRARKGSSKPDDSGVYKSKLHNFKVETFFDDQLKTPWAIDWLTDGNAIVTNRDGRVMVVDKARKSTLVEGVPESVELGQGGMMDVAVHPRYASNGWIYLTYSEPKKDSPRAAMTKVVRGKLKSSNGNWSWTSQETIFEVDQKFYTGAGIHFGSRIVFDGKGHVYFNVGERGGNMLAQEIDNPFGKIYRTMEDGKVPSDNPFVDQKAKGSHVAAMWSLGHRNPQGLAVDLAGNLWDTEHGPRGGDEVNLIKRGANYGWPVIAFSINYNDAPFRTPWPKEGQNLELPAFRWLPSTGASGLDTSKGNAFPLWKGDLLAGGLVGQNLDRLRMKDGKLVDREEILHGMGRIRDVAVGPDGFVYIVLNGPDKVVRLVPTK